MDINYMEIFTEKRNGDSGDWGRDSTLAVGEDRV